MTPSPKPKDPLEEFSENPLDIFYFYMGLLRDTIREVSPETWWGLLGQTPPQLKNDGSLEPTKVGSSKRDGRVPSLSKKPPGIGNHQGVSLPTGTKTEPPETRDNGDIRTGSQTHSESQGTC
jgi:hypothetical protein